MLGNKIQNVQEFPAATRFDRTLDNNSPKRSTSSAMNNISPLVTPRLIAVDSDNSHGFFNEQQLELVGENNLSQLQNKNEMEKLLKNHNRQASPFLLADNVLVPHSKLSHAKITLRQSPQKIFRSNHELHLLTQVSEDKQQISQPNSGVVSNIAYRESQRTISNKVLTNQEEDLISQNNKEKESTN